MKPKPLQVLVADDEPDIRTLVTHWLAEAGHVVMAAGSGKEATRLMKAHTFDLVVTDVLMADGDGLELIEHVKQLQPRASILAISGGGRYLEGDDCLKIARGFGAHWALLKPFNRDDLMSGIVRATKARREAGG